MHSFVFVLSLIACLLGAVSAQQQGCDNSPCTRGTCAASFSDEFICQCPEDTTPLYYGEDCDVSAAGHRDGICPGGHIWQPNEVRTYNNLPDRLDCFYLVAIPNTNYIEVDFLEFSIEIAKDEIAIGPGSVVDESRNIATTMVFDNSTRPTSPIRIDGTSQIWINAFTDKNIPSPGFSFRILADPDDCVSDPCQNGGTCTDNSDGTIDCTCPNGYTGVFCQIEIDFCSNDPCQNGGTCTSDTMGYTCTCAAGWTDPDCTTNIDECASMPCLNGATCIDGIDMWSCQCPPQYAGDICDISLNPCGSDPCYGEATCVNTGNDFVCECPPGYAGDLCEIDINECASLPCQNGGTCVNGVAMYTCQCRMGYSGVNCDEVEFCDLVGEWYNECNDRITITRTSTGMLLGDYSSNVGLLTGYMAPNVMVGYANQNCDFPSFGFVVTTDNGKSTTSWSGQCQLCAGKEVLYTTWTNTQRVNTCADIKTATKIGQDRWTKYKQSQAPREDNNQVDMVDVNWPFG